MSTEKIQGSSLQQQQALQRFQRVRREAEQSPRSEVEPETASARGAEAGEKLEISDRARRIQDLRAAVEAGRTALAEAPELREEAVSRARRHLDAGALSTAEARDVTAARLQGVMERLHRLLD